MSELIPALIVLLIFGPRLLDADRSGCSGLRAPDREQLEARRGRLTERDAAVRARYAQAVAVAGSEDRAAARVEDVDDPDARRFLQALAAADEAHSEIEPPQRGPRSRRAQARTLRRYERAVRALEDSWQDLGAPPDGGGRRGAPGPLRLDAARRLSPRRDGDQ